MSKQNKQNIIPSHEELMAFVSGNAADRSKDLEMAMESDAFLSDALDGYQKNADWVSSISAKVNSNLQTQYPAPKTGYKFYYLGGAALLIVIATIFMVNLNSNDSSEKMSQNKNDQVVEDVQPGANSTAISNDGFVSDSKDVIPGNSNNNDDAEMGAAVNDNTEANEVESEIVDAKENNNVDEWSNDEIVDVMEMNSNSKDKDPGNSVATGPARLAVIDCKIGIKGPPESVKSNGTKVVNGQIITKNKSNALTYNQDDLPSFYGGDDALEGEIKGSIRPVVVNLNSKYDRVIMFDFIVNANGKVDASSLNFMGNPYPEIKKQIVKLVAELPYFKPGKATGKKGRIQYSIMLKY